MATTKIEQSAKERIKVIKARDNQEMSQKDANDLMSKYVYMTDTQKVLDAGYRCEENVILFGPGGHGKSEFSVDFLKTKGIDNPYIITMGSGMNLDRLFGGTDIRKYKNTGELEYLVENSFMNHEYVIFEELFDAPDFILEQLKDILSSGVFRNGNQIFPIKTRLIICNTNRTREDFVKDASLSALMERFPLELEVKWPNYNKLTYSKLLDTVLGFVDPFLVYLLDKISAKDPSNRISPRICIKAAMMISEVGPDVLKYIAEFSKHKSILAAAKSEFKVMIDFHSGVEIMDKLMEEIKSVELDDEQSIENLAQVKTKLKELDLQVAKMEKIKVPEDFTEQKVQIVKSASAFSKGISKILKLAMDESL